VGGGSIWKSRGKWFIRYYLPSGQRIQESTGSPDRADAVRLLRQRQGEIAAGRRPGRDVDRVTFAEIAADLLRDYAVNGKRSLGKARKSTERLGEFFGGTRAAKITTADVRAYVERRQAAGFANGSINRELAALKRMFRLAVQGGRLHRAPHIPMLQEAAPRAGFFEAERFEAVVRNLPEAIRPVALFSHETGWRFREIITLEWRQVDLEQGCARLDPGTTKNREGRLAYLSPALLDVLRRQRAETQRLERAKGSIIPSVFHRRGRPVLGFRRAWLTACRKAGAPGMLFHDLRRTAVRNMVRAGVPERVAMQIRGHKTRAVFERYNIVSEGDLREAARKIGGATVGANGSQPGVASELRTVGGQAAR